MEGTNKRHWISWANICRPTLHNGLGITSLSYLSSAFATKLWWIVPKTISSLIFRALNMEISSMPLLLHLFIVFLILTLGSVCLKFWKTLSPTSIFVLTLVPLPFGEKMGPLRENRPIMLLVPPCWITLASKLRTLFIKTPGTIPFLIPFFLSLTVILSVDGASKGNHGCIATRGILRTCITDFSIFRGHHGTNSYAYSFMLRFYTSSERPVADALPNYGYDDTQTRLPVIIK
ncbi:hypothetical protein M9H77_19395 [Catharanthus roseus]|uniref:Uncharacterized protein n=1 Tax=Catharanthus roseus TaxID=4058 RepID=A0ACC0BA68_CATRO|nr:hypothetical protein M9H77_19395 [Catharanthus roseus]